MLVLSADFASGTKLGGWRRLPGGARSVREPLQALPDLDVSAEALRMRRTIGFVMALFLTFFGSSALIYLLLFVDGRRGWMVTGAGLALAVGAVWLYSERYFDATPNQQ